MASFAASRPLAPSPAGDATDEELGGEDRHDEPLVATSTGEAQRRGVPAWQIVLQATAVAVLVGVGLAQLGLLRGHEPKPTSTASRLGIVSAPRALEDCSWLPWDDCANADIYACSCRAQNPQGPCTACSNETGPLMSSCQRGCCGKGCPVYNGFATEGVVVNEVDNYHEECWYGGDCKNDGASVCNWCGLHNNSTMYCCHRDRIYELGHNCYGAVLAAESQHRCAVKVTTLEGTVASTATTSTAAPTQAPPPGFDKLGKGYCRTASGGKGTYTMRRGVNQSECSSECEREAACVAFEYDPVTDGGNCEVHSDVVTHTLAVSSSSACYVKAHYVKGVKATNECPQSGPPIGTREACQHAADSLRIRFAGEETDSRYPKGCYEIFNSVWWNKNLAGANDPDSIPLCNQATTAEVSLATTTSMTDEGSSASSTATTTLTNRMAASATEKNTTLADRLPVLSAPTLTDKMPASTEPITSTQTTSATATATTSRTVTESGVSTSTFTLNCWDEQEFADVAWTPLKRRWCCEAIGVGCDATASATASALGQDSSTTSDVEWIGRQHRAVEQFKKLQELAP